MIDSHNHLISNKCESEWNNFIKSNQEVLLDLADFALQEQSEDNLMVAISRAWYNGSCTMPAKPIKSLQLHYTMIQFFKYKLCTLYIEYILVQADLSEIFEGLSRKVC